MVSQEEIGQQLFQKYGTLIGGEDLRKQLGFKTSHAFYIARCKGLVDIRIFSIKHRKGPWAYTQDVASWLSSLSEQQRNDN